MQAMWGVSLYADYYAGDPYGWDDNIFIGSYSNKLTADFVAKVMANAYDSASAAQFTPKVFVSDRGNVKEKMEKEDYVALLHSVNTDTLEKRAEGGNDRDPRNDHDNTVFQVVATIDNQSEIAGFYNQQAAQEALEFLTVVNGTAAPFSIKQENVRTKNRWVEVAGKTYRVALKLGKRDYLHLLTINPFRQAARRADEVVQAALSEVKTCTICMERPKIVVLTPCGHYGFCLECVANLQICPNCRTPIANRVTVFE